MTVRDSDCAEIFYAAAMVSTEDITATCERYVALVAKGDPQSIVGLFAADATVEDPVGTEPKAGTDAIRAFYEEVIANPVDARLSGPVRVAGNEAAFPFEVHLGPDFVLPIIDVMTFADDGKITSMRAFFSS